MLPLHHSPRIAEQNQYLILSVGRQPVAAAGFAKKSRRAGAVLLFSPVLGKRPGAHALIIQISSGDLPAAALGGADRGQPTACRPHRPSRAGHVFVFKHVSSSRRMRFERRLEVVSRELPQPLASVQSHRVRATRVARRVNVDALAIVTRVACDLDGLVKLIVHRKRVCARERVTPSPLARVQAGTNWSSPSLVMASLRSAVFFTRCVWHWPAALAPRQRPPYTNLINFNS